MISAAMPPRYKQQSRSSCCSITRSQRTQSRFSCSRSVRATGILVSNSDQEPSQAAASVDSKHRQLRQPKSDPVGQRVSELRAGPAQLTNSTSSEGPKLSFWTLFPKKEVTINQSAYCHRVSLRYLHRDLTRFIGEVETLSSKPATR